MATFDPTENVVGVKPGMAFFGELFADFGVGDVAGKRLVDEGADFDGEFGDFAAVSTFRSEGVGLGQDGRLGGLRYGECLARFRCGFGAWHGDGVG